MSKPPLLALFGVSAVVRLPGSSERTEPIRVVEGQLGSIGGHETQVISVPPGGDIARIMIAGRMQDTDWELVTEVRRHEMLPIANACVTVGRIVPPSDSAPGAVEFSPPGDTTARPDGNVCVPAGARLRLNGPSLTTATDVELRGWHPNEQAPESVEAEWYPAKFTRENTPERHVHRARLRPGSVADLGSCRATVIALEGAAEHGPARLVLRLERAARDGY